MRFMAIASVSCASFEIDPYDMAPVEKRDMIEEIGSTSSIGIGPPAAGLSRSSPRSVPRLSAWSSTAAVYSLKIS